MEKGWKRRDRRERRRTRHPQLQRWVVIAVMLGIFGGLAWWNLGRGGTQVGLGAPPMLGADTSGGAVVGTERPPAGVGSQAQPIGTPPTVARESSSYAFIATQPKGDDPVAYDPCRAIHVVMDERQVIAGGGVLVQQALDSVSRATGLSFVVDGLTDEAPAPARPPYQPDRYGERWAPVLISWSDPGQTPELAGDVAGRAGSAWITTGSGSVFVSGTVELDSADLARIRTGFDGDAGVRSVIEHELGHLVGLDHVEDPTQLMNPTGGNVTTFADGDLTGLARLGAGACFPDV